MWDWVWRGLRRREGVRCFESIVTTLEVGRAPSKEPLQHCHGLIEVLGACDARWEGDAIGDVFGRMATGTDAQLDAAGRQLGCRGHDARQHRRVAVHHVGHERTESDA